MSNAPSRDGNGVTNGGRDGNGVTLDESKMTFAEFGSSTDAGSSLQRACSPVLPVAMR
jgi:hypothetical protein